jgi:hypothetical protein
MARNPAVDDLSSCIAVKQEIDFLGFGGKTGLESLCCDADDTSAHIERRTTAVSLSGFCVGLNPARLTAGQDSG